MLHERFNYDFFVSYSASDSAWVEGYLLDALTAARLRCWTLADAPPGTPYLIACEQAVERSRYTLLVLTPAYMAEVGTEIIEMLAHSHGAESGSWPVIPLILHEVERPARLRMLIPLDARTQSDWPQAVARLCRLVHVPAPSASAKRPCPYPGMAPFKDSDRDDYFGRNAELTECLARLRLYPFLALIGSSGSGKSSLLAAGLVPALRDAALSAGETLTVWTIRPGTTPASSLHEVVSATPADSKQLLIVDQFEELFSVSRAEALQFIHGLKEQISSATCAVVIAMRADFYPEVMACPLWSEVRQHRVELAPLDADGLRQAIVGPAKRLAVHIDQELVERLIVEAAGEPGSLPLVQETLLVLWERLERNFLPLRSYLDLSNVSEHQSGARGNVLKLAIARRAEAAIATLSQSEQVTAERIFLRLIQFGEGRADTRRQQLVSELQAHDEPVTVFYRTLNHLSQRHRLLTLSGDEVAAESKVDLAHEALIVGWPRLRRWITDLQQAEQERRSLEKRAAEWVDTGRSLNALLSAREQDRAEKFRSSQAAQILGCSSQLAELTDASRRNLDALTYERRRRETRERIQLGVLSAFLPGLGHLLSRRWIAGSIWMAVVFLAYVMPIMPAPVWGADVSLIHLLLPAMIVHCLCIWACCRLPKTRWVVLWGSCASLLLTLHLSELYDSQIGTAASQTLAPQDGWHPLEKDVVGIQDGSFEAGVPITVPSGWLAPDCSFCAGYAVSSVETGAKSGRRCALIDGTNSQGVSYFGNVMQSFPAGPYRMRRVRFKASVRTERPVPSSRWQRLLGYFYLRNRAQLWLRIDRQDGTVAFFENMATRPITSLQWRDYEISTVVPFDAETINVGAILIGSGKVYVDDAHIDVLDGTANAQAK